MSKPGISAYHRPNTLEEAWSHVAGGDPAVRLLSGGADLTIHAPAEVTTLVDLSRAVDAGIQKAPDGSIGMGAMATLTDVMEHPDLRTHATGVIPEMMVHVGNPLLRNFSTIGGHLARGKLSDVVPVFLALDATVTIYQGGDEITLALAEYYSKGRHSRPHILTRVDLPRFPETSAAAFLRFARTVFDFAILNVCCRIDTREGTVSEAQIVCGSTPRRAEWATDAESSLIGFPLTPEQIEAAARRARQEIITGSSWVASAEYRSQLVEVLTRRCLSVVATRLEEE